MESIETRFWNHITGITSDLQLQFHGTQDPIRKEALFSAATEIKLSGVTVKDIIDDYKNCEVENFIDFVDEYYKPMMYGTRRENASWAFQPHVLKNQVIYYISGQTGVKIGITTKKRLLSNQPDANRLAHMRLTFNDPTLQYLAVIDTYKTTGEYALFEENDIKFKMEQKGIHPIPIKNRQGAMNKEFFAHELHPLLSKAFERRFQDYYHYSKEDLDKANKQASQWSFEELTKALYNRGKGVSFKRK